MQVERGIQLQCTSQKHSIRDYRWQPQTQDLTSWLFLVPSWAWTWGRRSHLHHEGRTFLCSFHGLGLSWLYPDLADWCVWGWPVRHNNLISKQHRMSFRGLTCTTKDWDCFLCLVNATRGMVMLWTCTYMTTKPCYAQATAHGLPFLAGQALTSVALGKHTAHTNIKLRVTVVAEVCTLGKVAHAQQHNIGGNWSHTFNWRPLKRDSLSFREFSTPSFSTNSM